jgi:hypothetical protein
MAYSGTLFNIVMTWFASGYVADKIVNATYASRSTFWNYAHNSTLGNYIGAFEVINVLGLLTFGPILAAFGAAFSTYNIWARYEEIQSKNITLSKIEGFKYMIIHVAKVLSVWPVGLALGSSATSLISFYGTYNTASEATHCDGDGPNCTTDTDGTALLIDLTYHELATWGTVVLMLAIVFTGDEFWLDTMGKMAPK